MSPVYLTGFGPFPGVEQNPSQELIERIRRRAPWGERVQALVLTVAFETLGEELIDRLSGPSPSLLLHLGVAARRQEICLERCAYNLRQAERPDVRGLRSAGESLEEGRPPGACVETGIDLEPLVAVLAEAGLPARVSDDPGRYVCNALYYRSLRRSEELGWPARSLFVHLPAVGTLDPTGRAWSSSQLERGVVTLLEALVPD